MPPAAVMIDQSRRLLASGQHAKALELARRAAGQWPQDAEAARLLADLLSVGGNADQATFYYEKAVRLAPANASIRCNFGWHLSRCAAWPRAITELQEAIRLKADFRGAYANLILAFSDSGDSTHAAAVGREAVAKFPEDELLARNLAISLIGSGEVGEAVGVLRAAPGAAEGGGSIERRLLLVYAMNLWHGCTPEENFQEHVGLGRALAQAFPADAALHANDRDPDRPLRIGYLSQAFCNHSAGHFLEPILANHDRARYEIHCYCTNRERDELTERMRGWSAGWVEAGGMSPRQLADRIRSDRIDIAVDTTGHTSDSMLRALCHRPAPVQVTYLGYPNTTGLPTIDYRIIDAITDPPGSDHLATETLVRPSPCFLCYSPPPHAPGVAAAPPSASGSPPVFGTFNTNAKLSPPTLDLWARVLEAVPGSRLLLKNGSLREPAIAERRRREFADRGVDPGRLILIPGAPTKAEHMAMYGRLDVVLDPFPYNGTTTTVEALWMGVPVVALAGNSHVSRVSMSLLSAVGLGDLVASTADEYVRIAAGLAKDVGRLTDLRRTLRDRARASTLCDGVGFTRRLEGAYRQMWRTWCGAAGG